MESKPPVVRLQMHWAVVQLNADACRSHRFKDFAMTLGVIILQLDHGQMQG